MKKQTKQRQNEQAKPNGNTSSNEVASPVSKEAKQRLIQQYADRVESEDNSPKQTAYGGPRPEVKEGSIDPQIDTAYRIGPYDASGFYTQSQLNNNMSGNDANAIYQATHDQRMRRTWSDPDRDLYQQANDILTERLGYPLMYKYGTETALKPQDVSSDYDQYKNDELFYPEGYVSEAEYNDLFFKPDTRGGEALNRAYSMIGHKPNTSRQEWMPSNRFDAYVTGADSTIIPDRAERLWEGVGSYVGIPDELLVPDAKQNMYFKMLEKWMENNHATPLWM